MNTKKSSQKKTVRSYKTLIQVALIIISTSIIIYICLQNYQKFISFFNQIIEILQPVIYGVVLAYLMTPICNFLQKKLYSLLTEKTSPEKAAKYSHMLSVALSIIILILIIFLFLVLIIPQLISSITGFISQLPQHTQSLRRLVNNAIDYINFNLPNQIQERVISFFNSLIQNLSNLLPNLSSLLNDFSSYVYNVATTVFNFIIGIIVTAYSLDKKEMFALQAKKILFAFLPKDKTITVLDKVHEANNIFLNFLVGKLIDSLIIGIICFAGVLILRMPYPILISTIIGITNIIPFFGPFLGAVPCTIIILLENPIQSIYFIIFIFLLQQFDGNILGPKILGDTTGVTSFWVLFSILLFGGLWGIFGMVVGVPLFAMIYSILKEIVDNRLKKKGLPTQAYEYRNPARIDEIIEEEEDKEDK